MSWLTMRAILDMEAELSGTEKLLLLVLRIRAGDNGRCWPSQSRLARDTGLTERTIQAATAKLKLRGLIEVEPAASDRRSNEYRLNLPEAASRTPKLKHERRSSIAKSNSGNSRRNGRSSFGQIPEARSTEGLKGNGKEGAQRARLPDEPRTAFSQNECVDLAQEFAALRRSLS